MVAELDVRSDVYALGAILYAILTLRAPIDGKTLDEVLSKVRSGQISPMATRRGGKADKNGKGGAVAGVSSVMMESEVPAALQSVTMKAMATQREKRYAGVEGLVADIEAYQNGFATSAEDAGAWTRARLWVGRNRVLAVSAAVLVLVVSGFTTRVIQKGREASQALASLRETAPTFAVRAQDALRGGQFEEALKAATFAVKLEPKNSEYHALRGNALQVLVRWPEAVEAYRTAVRLGADAGAKDNLALMESLLVRAKGEGEAKAKVALFEELNGQGRQSEAMEFGRELGDFWKDRKRDLSVLPELVKQLEAKLLPVPGTKIRMSKTEMTVGEWKLYLKADGLPDWQQPGQNVEQTDEHPVVNVSWNRAKEFCDWLSARTGKQWRLPTNAEWEAAVGPTKYPWGDYYPPHWDDGNYAVGVDGKEDPQKVGVDGILGTAPVGSFKPNALGFYDLGGNVWEWMWDGQDEKTGNRVIRGGSWYNNAGYCAVGNRFNNIPTNSNNNSGFRLALSSDP
jgi:tetratricopeptide (TPR) repeat protein